MNVATGFDNDDDPDRFFNRGDTLAGVGNYEYAIEMYLQGLELQPDVVEVHAALREVSLKRKASGGKPMGMLESIKLRGSADDKHAMLNAEKLLAYDPGNTDHMVEFLEHANRAGFVNASSWMKRILDRALEDR